MTTLDPLQTRMDAYLDAIDRALHDAQVPRPERRAITDEVEAQVREMLARRSAQPTSADLEAVLAELDPPEAYGASARGGEVTQADADRGVIEPRLSRVALVGLGLGLLAPMLAVIPFLMLRPSTVPQSGPDAMEIVAKVMGLVGIGCAVGMVLCGIVAATQISKPRSGLYGMPLATFDIACYPVVVILLLIFAS